MPLFRKPRQAPLGRSRPLLRGVEVPVDERAQEGDDSLFLGFVETEVPGLGDVEIGWLLGLRPAIDADRLLGALAVGKDVAGVVEMHDRLQVGEIAVMHVGAFEARSGDPGDVSQCRVLKGSHV